MAQIVLSDEAKSMIAARTEQRKSLGKFVNLGDGESTVLRFDPDKEAKYVEKENSKYGTKSKRYQYEVIDPNQPDAEKIFEANMQTSQDIDNLFTEGFATLKIKRQGSDKTTKYFVTPAGG